MTTTSTDTTDTADTTDTTARTTAAHRATRLVGAGAAAAPIYAAAVLAQAATRAGFDITRHPASILANGELGWVQVATSLLTGTLMLVCAVGARRVLGAGPGRVWQLACSPCRASG